MKHFVITIGREFGCNAREIGRQLAAKLNVKFYDKELVDLAAQKAGVSEDVFLRIQKAALCSVAAQTIFCKNSARP